MNKLIEALDEIIWMTLMNESAYVLDMWKVRILPVRGV